MRKGDSTQYITSIQNQLSTYDNQNDNIAPPTYAVATGETPHPSEICNDDDDERGLQEWCERQQKNKPQSNSIAAGIMMLLYSGLHIGWGVYRLNLDGVWYKAYTTRSQLLFIILVFYFGSKLGAIIGHYWLSTIKKTNIYYFCGALNIISSIAFMAGYDEICAIFVGRIFAGLAYGICYMTVIVHASENCIKEIRGLIVTSINYIIIASLITVTAFDNNLSHPNTDNILSTDFWVGLIGLCYTIIGILCVPFLTYESVIFLIMRGKDDQAIKNMIKLRNESMETLQIRRDYEEIYQMVEEDKMDSKCVFENNHGIYLLMLTQLLTALSTSMAINLSMLYIMYLFININYGIIMVAPRFVIALIPIFFSDFIGRRYLLLPSSFFAGIILIVLGILTQINNISNLVLVIFILLYQGVIGLGTNAIPDVLLSEAFSITKKIGSIRFLFIFEQFLHVILIIVTMNIEIVNNLKLGIFFSFGILLVIISSILFLYLPETKKKSLRETKKLFKRIKAEIRTSP